MKNILLISFLTSFAIVQAQNRAINFEHGNLASVYEKAKKENKLIFVDAYTSWCGPCKWMAKNVFTNDTVADYFNTTFVNYKLDMEKGEGIAFAQTFTVGCYPSLLFIDGTGKLVHRGAGGLSPQPFIEFAAHALSPDKSFSAQMAEFDKTGLTEKNVIDYISLVSSCCLNPREKVNIYIKSIKEEDYIKRNNWILIRDYAYDQDSREIKYFFKNYAEFEKKYGTDTVELKVIMLGKNYFAKSSQAPTFDKPAFEKIKKEFLALNWPQSKRIVYEAELDMTSRLDKTRYYELASAEFLDYNINNSGALNSMAWKFYENVTDKKQLKAATKMAERACALNNSYAYLDTYAAVLYKSGDLKEAEKVANMAIDIAKKGNMPAEDYKETDDLLKKIAENLS